MKTLCKLILVALFLPSSANAQLTKGNWLVGGSGSFTSTQSKSIDFDGLEKKSNTLNEFNISPNVGYFIVDKLAIGTLVNINTFSFLKDANDTSNTIAQSYSFGPYIKYYFLDAESRFNILAQTGCFIGLNSNASIETKGVGYNFKVGPVVYFNSSVGLEFLIEYNTLKRPDFGINTTTRINKFQVGLGLQIHLKK